MADEPVETHEYHDNESSPLKYVLIAIAGIYVIASLVLFYNLNDKLSAMQKAQADAQKQMDTTDAKLHASTEALAAKLGMTEKELAARTDQLQRAQRSTSAKQAELGQQLSDVNTQVAGVKTDVGGVKGDVASTKTDLEATKAKLERVTGDLGQQSGLIARTREDLEFLKHKGDRNIYEFTLQKGKKIPVSTITLQLKKADPKKSKFTMNVIADDRTIEKKDRTAFEPMQFYTGRDRLLYEVVVMAVDKNQISGYLSTPKAAPLPPQ